MYMCVCMCVYVYIYVCVCVCVSVCVRECPGTTTGLARMPFIPIPSDLVSAAAPLQPSTPNQGSPRELKGR